MRQYLIRATMVLLVMALAACETAVSDSDDRFQELTQQDWIAERIDDVPVIGRGRVTLAFIEGRVSGRGGCNIYSGPVEIGNGTLKIGTLISTKMACAGAGVMQQENAYLDTLRSAQRFTFDGAGNLIISSAPGGAIVYSPVPRQQRPETP